MFVKVILFAALVMIVISLMKRGQRGQKAALGKHSNTAPSPTLDKATKRCAQCGVHLPESEALKYQTLHFCCNDHKKDYLEDTNI